jgi:hypothetical protein
MRRQLRVGLVIAVLSLAWASCGGGNAQPADPAAWAAAVCGAEQQFADAIVNSRDNQDPGSLELAERKDRAVRLGEIERDAAQQLAADLGKVDPPDDAKEFHRALIQNADDLDAAIKTQVEAIGKATTAQQIAVANASAEFEVQASNNDVTAKAAALPDDLVQALGEQQSCGRVPIPGGPAVPTSTPSI